MEDRSCSIEGCDRGGKIVRGMCQRHYDMWLRATPADERPEPPRKSRRFEDFVSATHPQGCWPWTGPLNPNGYGMWSGNGYKGLAHRYSLAQAELPPHSNSCALHHCDNPPCVNPDHLYWGGHRENALDAVSRGRAANANARKTHCKNNHELAGINLIALRQHDGKVHRRCKICDNARKAASARRARRRRAA